MRVVDVDRRAHGASWCRITERCAASPSGSRMAAASPVAAIRGGDARERGVLALGAHALADVGEADDRPTSDERRPGRSSPPTPRTRAPPDRRPRPARRPRRPRRRRSSTPRPTGGAAPAPGPDPARAARRSRPAAPRGCSPRRRRTRARARPPSARCAGRPARAARARGPPRPRRTRRGAPPPSGGLGALRLHDLVRRARRTDGATGKQLWKKDFPTRNHAGATVVRTWW